VARSPFWVISTGFVKISVSRTSRPPPGRASAAASDATRPKPTVSAPTNDEPISMRVDEPP
jgi:hypothetical protein